MIGKTNSQTDVIRDERVNVLLTTNQSSHDDLKGAVITIAYENVRDEYEYTGSMLTAKVPPYVSYTISVSDVAGYAKPAAVSAKAVAGNSRSVTMTYNTTVVTVKMADNQSAYNDIAGATATVAASGISTVTVKDGGSVKVPTGVSCSVTWSAVSGYKTPDKQTFTTSGTSVSKTGTYQTEILTVTVTSDIDLPASYTITVSGIGSQTTASKTYKVPFGTSYTVSASKTSDYKAPKDQSFVANSINRTVVVQYLEFKIGSWITIDQTIQDPTTMISGEVNGEHIRFIRQNSHRYLGKYTSSGTMSICQLDDSDSNLFCDGTKSDLSGTYGDVFMKLPRFWYKVVEKRTDVWNIGFYYGEELPDLADWKEWDENHLIGVFSGTVKGSSLYSVDNGKTPFLANFSSFSQCHELVTSKGSGYSFVRWEHHCIMAFLFFAMYGNTNSQDVIGDGSSSTVVGVSSSMGMQDTQGGTSDVNFWGLERWWGCSEILENARCNPNSINRIIKVTDINGTVRELPRTINKYANRYASRIFIGEHLDFVCTLVGASSTSGYCDVLAVSDNNNAVNGYVYRSYDSSDRTGITCYRGDYFKGSYLRLAFYGNIIIVENPSDFILL